MSDRCTLYMYFMALSPDASVVIPVWELLPIMEIVFTGASPQTRLIRLSPTALCVV